MWEERFSTKEYVFGRAPALFLRRHEDRLTPGATALSVADGEVEINSYRSGRKARRGKSVIR